MDASSGLTFVTAADHGFHQGIDTLLKSFVISNRELAPLNLLVMDCGLAADFLTQLAEEMREFSRTQKVVVSLQFVKADLLRWKVFPPHWGSYAAYAFLEAIEVVTTRHLVFADADVLHFAKLGGVLHSLRDSGHSVAALVDDDYECLEKDFYVNQLSALQPHERSAPYLNSGYLIFDLKHFSREEFHLFVQGLDPSKAHETFKGVKKFKHDQTILNCFVKGRFMQLGSEYNFFCRHNRQLVGLKRRKNFHFVGQPKPWEKGDYSTAARQAVFEAAESILNSRLPPPLPVISPRILWFSRLKASFYSMIGKNKKARQAREAIMSRRDLQEIQQTIMQWCKL